MAKVKVAVVGTVGRVVTVDQNATYGAILGTNLFTPEGAVSPAAVRAWLGLQTTAELEEEGETSGIAHHRLLQGLTLGDDHPQYTQWVQDEVITGAWTFENVLTVDINDGVQVVMDEDEVHTTVPIRATNYDGLLVENPDFIGAGVHITTETGTNPLNNGVGTQIAFWEVGDDPGSPFTPYSYGFRIHHSGEIDSEGNMDWYRHSNSVPGVLFMRFTRESSQIQFADGSASAPVLTHIGDLNTGIYWRVNDELNFSTGGSERLNMTSVGIDASVPYRAGAGSAANPSYTRIGDVDNGMYFPAADQVGFSTNGTLRLHLTNSLVTSAPAFMCPTLELGSTTDTTISRASAGVAAVEGHSIATISQAQTISAIYSFSVAPRFGATLTPAQITANVDNYAPAGIGDASHLRVDTDASRDITGLTTGTTGRWIVITNVGAFDLVFRHDNTGSTAANRFFFDDAASMTLEPEQTRYFWYDATTQRWRVLVGGGGGGGGVVDSIVEGEAIVVDATDASNPIVGLDIPSLTAEASPDAAADYAVIYSDSAGLHRKVLLQDLPGGGGGSGQVVRYDVYSADDTWNKPSGFAFGLAIGIGQGGGGASGRFAVAGGGRVGGGGGGGGGRSVVYFNDSDVGATAAVTVNGGGTGGAARTGGSDQNGADGTAGEDTTFGTLLTAEGGGGGTGGTNSGNSAAGVGGEGNAGDGSTGGTGYATAAQVPAAIAGGSTGGGGGCGGAGVTAANADGTGGAGAASITGAAGAAPVGSPPGGNGGNGGDGDGYNGGGGGGGSGNGSDVSTTLAGDGGDGGDFGGGGGGGAGGTRLASAGASGAGGDGGDGVLIVISWMNVGAGTGLLDSVVAGFGVTVDNSDPINPVVAVDVAEDFDWTGDHIFESGELDVGESALAANVNFNINAATGQLRRINWRTGGLNRWLLGVTSTAESGSNVGCDFTLLSRDDSGAAINTNLVVRRSTGAWEFDTGGLNTAAAPGLSWSGDTNSGFYRAAADQIGIAAGGVQGVLVGAATVTLGTTAGAHQILVPAVNDPAVPTISFLADTDTGIYRSAANIMAFASNGALIARVAAGQFIVDAAFRMSTVLSPAQLTANTDNYAPTGIDTACALRLSTDASRNLTGISATASIGRILYLMNIGAQDLVLVNDATSTAANRFLLGANITVGANEGVTLMYDATSSRWRCVGKHV